MKLTDPTFIRRLESLYLLARKVLGGRLQADRKTTKKGSGITFADYSEYSFGDDHRAIDWRIYARLEQLMIKMFELEEEMTLYLLLDVSRSMRSKFDYARQLAAALGYIALSGLDQVVIYAIGTELSPILEPAHGRGRILPMLRSLEQTEIQGRDSRFNACCRAFQARHSRRGMMVIVSDFLFPDGFDEGLSFLQWNGHEVFALQVQDQQDLTCAIRGDAELACIETDACQRVTITTAEAAAYEAAVAQWNRDLQRACAKRGIGMAFTTPELPFDDVIQRILRRGGLVA